MRRDHPGRAPLRDAVLLGRREAGAPKGTSAMRRLTTALMSVERISSRFPGLDGMTSSLIQLGLYQRT